MLNSGFFNSMDGDRRYNAEDLSKYFGSLISNGVLPNPSTNLQVEAAGGMTIHVHPGKAYIDCHYLENTAMFPLSVAMADPLLPRTDAVIMRMDLTDSARNIDIKYVKGVANSTPSPPGLTRSNLVKDYCLAQIRVNAGASSITQANITDTRPDTKVCGWVTALITQVDTSTLFQQWLVAGEEFFDKADHDFYTWLNSVKDILADAVNGDLLLELIELYQSLYIRGTEDDIDRIISGTYTDADDDTGGIFETATKEDIDRIISGEYQDSAEDNVTGDMIKEIVDNAFL